jgi:hypothetical protein
MGTTQRPRTCARLGGGQMQSRSDRRNMAANTMLRTIVNMAAVMGFHNMAAERSTKKRLSFRFPSSPKIYLKHARTPLAGLAPICQTPRPTTPAAEARPCSPDSILIVASSSRQSRRLWSQRSAAVPSLIKTAGISTDIGTNGPSISNAGSSAQSRLSRARFDPLRARSGRTFLLKLGHHLW